MTIHNEVLDYDLKKCVKKWYSGLDEELPRVLRLLYVDKVLPGQLPMRGFSGDLAGKIWHARINLPNKSFGKRKGARLVYFFSKGPETDIRVLYVGGHKDPIYDTRDLVKVVASRYKSENTNFITYESYKQS